MQLLIELSLIYIIGGTFGWILELIYRRFAHRRWINPGFLVGPNLPLYGTGVVALYLLCNGDYSFLPSPVWRTVFLIVLITLTMTAIEYVTGLYFTKRENVKLWDYSNRWGNVDGIICPLFSAIWGLIGTGYLFFVHAPLKEAAHWIGSNTEFSYFVGAYFGIMAVDVCYSFGVVGKIRAFAKEQKLTVRYEEFKNFIRQKAEEWQEKTSFILAFKTGAKPLREVLEKYFEEMEERRELRRENRRRKRSGKQ